MGYVEAIPSLANELITVTRRTETPKVAGREQPTTDIVFPGIIASVQAPTGKDLDRDSDGRSVQDLRVVFTEFVLQAGGPGTGLLSDLVEIQGTLYELEHLEDWSAFDEGYCRAVVRAI